MLQIIPMEEITNYKFSCIVTIDEGTIDLGFHLMYNDIIDYWTVDVFKQETEVITAYPLIPAQNILEQFSYLKIGSAWIVHQSEIDLNEEWPSANTLASKWYVVWGDTDAA